MNKRYLDIRQKAKVLAEKNKKTIDTYSYKKVVGLLSGLGFLIAPEVRPCANVKVSFDEAFNIAINIEPRILEVLPAAIISFPKSFLHIEKAPEQFMQVVAALKAGKTGPDIYGIKFEKFYEAANRPIRNGKRKVISERRIPKTFRIRPSVLNIIETQSKKLGLNYTAYLENIILSKQE